MLRSRGKRSLDLCGFQSAEPDKQGKDTFPLKIRVLLRNKSTAKELISYGSFQSGTEQRLSLIHISSMLSSLATAEMLLKLGLGCANSKSVLTASALNGVPSDVYKRQVYSPRFRQPAFW